MHPLLHAVERWQQGDRSAGEEIMSHPMIIKMLDREAGNFAPQHRDDLKQEASWRILKSLRDNFEFSEDVLPCHQYSIFISYMRRSVRFCMITYYNRSIDHTTQHLASKSNPTFYMEQLEMCEYDEERKDAVYSNTHASAEDEFMETFRNERILEAISELKPIEQDIIMAKYYKGEQIMPIRHKYNLSTTAISWWHKRALEKLSRKLYQYSGN